MRSKRSNIKARYDAEADAAYIIFAPGLPGGRTTTNCESSLGDFTTINLDWLEAVVEVSPAQRLNSPPSGGRIP